MRALTFLILFIVFSLILFVSPVPAAETQAQSYLTYGTPVAPDEEISSSPEPYDASIHGSLLLNTKLDANVVGDPNVTLPKRPLKTSLSSEQIPPLDPGSGDRGLWLTSGTGIYAQNDAQTNLLLPDAAIGTTIYAPTHLSPGGTCIETVTAHWRYEGMSTTSHGHGFWDWCGSDGTIGWQVFEFMDSDWISKYVRKLNGEPRYWTQVYQDSSTSSWKGLLYNFKEGRWEEKTSISGTSSNSNNGWTMWESHFMMDQAQVCPAIPNIKASNLKLWVDGKWSPLTTDNSQDSLGPYGYCWTSGKYTFRVSPKLNMWSALTQK